LKDKRLGVFNDELFENSFIIATSEMVFARINKIGDLWCVWYYTKHYQKNFSKIREALSDINETFIDEVLS
jgi:hypothetical protein